jgi:protocatechuate 4,5-dioxygenase alpha chain
MPEETRIPGTYVFTGERSTRGYAVNKLASSLISAANRAAFLNDEAAYMARFSLTAAEQEMVRQRDWGELVKHGGNIYLLLKIAGTLGSSLLAMGAQMRGETLEQFLATRPGIRAARQRD